MQALKQNNRRKRTLNLQCDSSFSYSGEEGTFQFTINLGTATGQAGIHYQAFDVPDKFSIEWNGQIFTTGYVGWEAYNDLLIDNHGIDPSEINTADPSNGLGYLLFDKNTPEPQTAKVIIEAPEEGTGWDVMGVCPGAELPTFPEPPPPPEPPTVNVTFRGYTNGVATFDLEIIETTYPVTSAGVIYASINDGAEGQQTLSISDTEFSIELPPDTYNIIVIATDSNQETGFGGIDNLELA